MKLNACREIKISIHALREEGDAGLLDDAVQVERHFYPRPPRGGRRNVKSSSSRRSTFLSTPSARRATRVLFLPRLRRHYFYPRPPRGGRRLAHPFRLFRHEISIHALREEGDKR